MILAGGKVYPSEKQDGILDSLEEEINDTRMRKTLDMELVIEAFDKLSCKISNGEFDALIRGMNVENAGDYIDLAAKLLRREHIEYKIRTELGRDFFTPKNTQPPFDLKPVEVRPSPLGTLFHIAAGNIDVLPAYSVAEGLLTGNVNILKLPQADQGLSIEIFLRLIEIEPELKDYIYVFDTPSADINAMRRMADMADGIVVWGGEAATRAVRQLAPAGAKLIEWGHRLGFAYISGYQNRQEELAALAEHIISTRQLFCSSCQVIYLDTESMKDIEAFCQEFLPCLDAAAKKHPVMEIGAVAEMTLRRYNDLLERAVYGSTVSDRRVFQGEKCSLTVCEDSVLELSYMYGNCLVKRLPRKRIMSCLRKGKGYLQTAGLIADAGSRKELTELLIRCGINRIMSPGHMSESFSGEAHDGEYPMRRYTRIVNVEML